MARLSDADENRFPLPRFNPRGADRSRSRAAARLRETRRLSRHSGVAELLLQVPDDCAGAVSRTRSLRATDETEKHDALGHGPRNDHAPLPRVLRLTNRLIMRYHSIRDLPFV